MRRSLHGPLLSQATWSGGEHAGQWAFPAASTSFWHSARVALFQGVRRAGLQPGERVLVPAYCCGVEVTTLQNVGLEPVYYRLLENMTPDLDHLGALCRSTPAKALLLIHYFGLPQPIDPILAFAREHDLLLIEDAAHGLFAVQADGAPLGSRADVAVFSLKKHLPLPNGGLLVCRTETRTDPGEPARPPDLQTTARTMTYLAVKELEHRWPGLSDGLRRVLHRPDGLAAATAADSALSGAADSPSAAGKDFDVVRRHWGASRFSLELYRRARADDVRARRARHFRVLQEAASHGHALCPLYRTLPEGASPWLFPVLAERPDDLRRDLWASGIVSIAFWRYVHPTIPRPLFPLEEDLRRRVVALPVHHGLSAAEVDRMAGVLRRPSAQARP